MAKPRIRGAGGRPRQDGERYANGRLKPPPPNPYVLERRKALCDDPTLATCPMDVAYARGWISQAEHAAGRAYISVHASAGFNGPGYARDTYATIPSGSVDELKANWSEMTPAQVAGLRWADLSAKDIARIWDSALRDLGRYGDPTSAETFAAESTRKWRALNAAMTTAERLAVDAFCIRETWPQWLGERLAGRMRSRWEADRDVLIAGLRTIERALRKPKSAAVRDLVLPEPPRPRAGPVVIERTEIVDDDGAVVQVHERIKRAS